MRLRVSKGLWKNKGVVNIKISLIAAVGKNGELGLDNKLLWDIPEDMKWFRKQTEGKTVVMGRTTYESIGKPLPRRKNIVLSRNPHLGLPDSVIVLPSVLAVMKEFRHEDEIVIIGGSQIYEQFLPSVDTVYLTRVAQSYEADTFFPGMLWKDWDLIHYQKGSGTDGVEYGFYTYERK